MRRQLSYFALVLLIPILAFVGFVLFEFATGERARLEQDALSNARRIAVAVDRELANLTAALDVLAESPPLLADDLPAFHDQLLRLRERQGLTAVLRDLSGQQIVNARVPFGSPLPRNLLEDEEQAIEPGTELRLQPVHRRGSRDTASFRSPCRSCAMASANIC